MAFVVDVPITRDFGIADRLVVCAALRHISEGLPAWRLEEPIRAKGWKIVVLADELLRPLRRADDDEPTQETRPLPLGVGMG